MACACATGIVKGHWSDVTQRRTASQEEAERHLVCGLVRFRRLMLVPAAVLVQLCVGSLYAWSVYNLPIEKAAGFETGTAANTFYVAVGCFGPSAALFGPWLERRGPRLTLLLSSTLFFIGNMLGAVAVSYRSLAGLYIGFGVVGGAGLGISYIAPVSPLQKWFPDRRGLVSGLAVCGFGGGTIVASKAQQALIGAHGVPFTFCILGATYYALMLLCAVVLRTPPEGFDARQLSKSASGTAAQIDAQSEAVNPEVGEAEGSAEAGASAGGPTAGSMEVLQEPLRNVALVDAITAWDYRLMYLMLMCNSVAGLLTISKMADICQLQFGADADLASTVVSVNSAFNLGGRVVMPLASDFVGRKPLFIISLGIQAAIILATPTMISVGAFWPWVVGMWVVSALYGAGFGLIPAFLTDMFGPKNIGALHGIILTGWSLIGVAGGFVFTYLYNRAVAAVASTHGVDITLATPVQVKHFKADPTVYNTNYYWIGGLIVVGLLLTPLVRTGRDRLFPARPGQLFALRLGPRLLRYSQAGLEWVPRKQEEEEWRAYLRKLPENQKA